MRHVVLILLATLFLPATVLAAPSFERTLVTFVEEFDGNSGLEGAVRSGKKGVWTATIRDGQFRLKNHDDNAALRFFDIPSAAFPLIDRRGTDGADVSAVVQVDEAEDGSAGVLVGYPHGRDYFGFAIGVGHSFTILSKRDGRLRRLHTGSNPAVLADEPNLLELRRVDDQLRFFVNDEPVYSLSAEDLDLAPVGIFAVGRGSFTFDRVAVTPSDRMTDRYLAEFRACDFPRAMENDHVVVLSAYEGAAAAGVTVAGQDGTTKTVELTIAAGDQPLYLVASSYEAMIWRVTGATARVRHFAVAGRGSEGAVEAGVVGLDRDRLSFHTSRDCLGYAGPDDPTMRAKSEAVVTLALGVIPDEFAVDYDPVGFVLPSVQVLPPDSAAPQGIDPKWSKEAVRDALRFDPAGLVHLLPSAVISLVKPEPYDVLPQQWGIAQLEADGVLVREGYNRFRVVRPIRRLPAGLAGAHQVDFILPADMPIPEGYQGHSSFTFLAPAAADSSSTGD